MSLGKKIHQLRKGCGMSQEELAEQLTISRQAISKWELDESVPDTENVVQLSKIFRVSTDYLLNDEYEGDNDTPTVKVSNEHFKMKYQMKTRILSYCIIAVALFICIAGLFAGGHIGTHTISAGDVFDDISHIAYLGINYYVLSGVLMLVGIIVLLSSFNLFKKEHR
ncbi:MAG: helix-turn-helix domain-containing protein [Oscillospiraceae bacterium]|jgi:transcriptional regulator with XRE-family HTH domain|nr:helix-turn-helix domain-containing protein [Oscillospiraceae bacterium]